MRAVWLLHNPQAGLPHFAGQVEAAAEALARRGLAVRLEHPTDIDGMRQAARAAVAAGADAVLAAGGDGTAGAIAGELAGTPVALGTLPAGTANVWAAALGLPRPWPWRPGALVRAALCLAESPAYLTDVGECNGRAFLVWAGVGLDGYVTRQYERRRARLGRSGGFMYNALVTLALASRWRGVAARVRAEGPGGAREAAGRYLMLTVSNIGWHGGGLLHLAGDTRLDDGLMDAWVFAGGGYADMLAHAVRVLRGRHQAHPGLLRLTGTRFEIYTAEPQPSHLDAEPQPPAQHWAITVLPRRLRVLAPPREALYVNPPV